MDETTSPQTPEKISGLNKLDLTQLQGFSFGTSWVQDKSGAGDNGGGRGGDRRDERPRREGGGEAAPRRDRRDFKRPTPGVGDGQDPGALRPANNTSAPKSANVVGDRRPTGPTREGGPAQGAGAPRSGAAGERPRFERREQGGQGGYGNKPGSSGSGGYRGDFRGASREPVGPYISPYFFTTFYPEDSSFKVLAEAIRKSCRTFELFYIAKSVVEKNERFVAVVQRIPQGQRSVLSQQVDANAVNVNAKPSPFFISVPDSIPFDTEEGAIAHVMEKHLANFFETTAVEVEAPKGNFQVVNRCTITGALLAPPNYHLYNQIVAQHNAAHVRMSPEAYKSRIETVREPEAIAQWLEKMKKATRYTVKPAPVKIPKSDAAAKAELAKSSTEATDGLDAAHSATLDTLTVPPVDEAVAKAESVTAVEPQAMVMPSFPSLEEARQWLLSEAKHRVVRAVEQLRFPGKLLESIPATGEVRKAVEGALAAQRRFPLDTANALRGRLRRENFTIFKKGSKGVSYVCAVKRRFRVPGQSFSDSLASLIKFIETHPMVKESELGALHLGFAVRSALVEGVPPEPMATNEIEKLTKLKGDLRYLVKEGYITEFVDGSLFCQPAMVEARKREIEATDVDPENFPEATKVSPRIPRATPGATPVVDETKIDKPHVDSLAPDTEDIPHPEVDSLMSSELPSVEPKPLEG
jgi:hypothetical protein